MGTKKISQLPADASPSTTDSVPTYDAETALTKRATLASLIALFFDFTNVPAANLTGWIPITATLSVSTGYNKGNKEFDITSSSDLSGILTPGMRLKFARGTTPPTQCTDLESSSSQYAVKTSPSGITFTDDFTVEAWVKIESWTGADAHIVARQTSAGAAGGWSLELDSSSRVVLRAHTGAGAADLVTSTQSIPIGVWVHIAATIDMSGNAGTIYINGSAVSTFYTDGGGSSLTQAGDMTIGSSNSPGEYFDGKISDVRIWSAARTATQIRDNMNQQLTGSETNLVGYYKLNGNFNDSTSNANNMTAQNSATATSTDNPMNSTEYFIVHKVTASTVTVFGGTDYNVPNGTLSTPYYALGGSPYGWPAAKYKWRLEQILGAQYNQGSPSAGTWYNMGGYLDIPTGEWEAGYDTNIYGARASGSDDIWSTLSTGSSTSSDDRFAINVGVSAATDVNGSAHTQRPLALTAQTRYYLNIKTDASGMTNIYVRGNNRMSIIYAQSAYA